MTYEYERVATPVSGLRLHLNENTAGCSPAVIEAIRALTREQIAEYPDYDAVIEATAARLNIAADSLLLTNGLDEGILVASMVALRANAGDTEGIVVVPAFDMYAACTDALGGHVVQVPLGDDFAFPSDRVVDAVTRRTRIVWLTNPNNPTGQSIPREAIARVAVAAGQAIVFVDEAYADFGGRTLIGDSLLRQHANVIVGRTFAKAYGLAGIRAGAVIGDPVTIASLRRVAPPYGLNVCAAAALPPAFRDRDYYDWYVDQVAQSRELLYAGFQRLGVRYWKSDANFVLAKFEGRGPAIASALAARGVHVRDRSNEPGCEGCLRVTAGVVEHTRRFLAALEAVL
ncbi:MAG TPA: aminotransferase class I/II-fold pyridoxal phosphate-dependent enzyme [Vicinamibacterales bacterium]|nr:aminotransferase class I/II-fold pyridoxal phosphate-dependent enzyme [Vicinamibacterales bacterium]